MARAARTFAIAIWLLIVALSLAELWMIAVTLDRPSDQWGIRGYEAVLGLAFGSVGALIVTRRHGNVIGWLALIAASAVSFQGVLVQYAVLSEASASPLPLVGLARWASAWVWVLSAGTFLAVFPLVFPDGRLPSARWRPALYLGVGAIVLQAGLTILVGQPFGPVPPTNNPAPYFERGGPFVFVGYAVLWVAGLVAASSLIHRYRQARGDERQ
jgi:hypothetical protein